MFYVHPYKENGCVNWDEKRFVYAVSFTDGITQFLFHTQGWIWESARNYYPAPSE